MAFPLSEAEHFAIRDRIEAQEELIVAVAIRVPFGDRFINLTAERPYRHGDLIYAAGLVSGDRMKGGEHGFITNHGRFVGRGEAGRIVARADQGSPRQGLNGHLFSEDMWLDHPAESGDGVGAISEEGTLPPDEPVPPTEVDGGGS